ncbi:hypothetical protein [Chryseobacterium lathyri]|uniref:Lipoprotein n=1 Tax=Chryseobacterium lathyri TaxID=395933 RepID=A0ABT9SRD9_9FLAO|nr:hypothetical protein [Chryseobacterium lathyri]MDP9962014.1 hypothetical protein [Chryseobacterium lathyri]MDQ0064171.1 hypothetical protein [Chryseobacterium lathyri]
MRKNFYFIIVLFSLTSCYTYQVKKQVDPAADNKQNTAAPQSPNAPQAPAPINIQEKLASGKNVKIDVEGKSYKVIVDKWESDSLVAHPVHNPKKIMKFHKNQINAEKIAEKRFSQPIADIITVTAYAAIGAGIWYLLQ